MSLKVGSSRGAAREARGTPFAAEPHMRRWLAVFVLLCGLAAPVELLQTPSLRPAPEPRLHIADAPAPAPERIVIIDRVETVAVPVYVPVPSHHGTRRDDRDDDSRSRRPSTVFWGYGGKQRPDS